MSFLDRITTKHLFHDGARITILHKYAMRLDVEGRSVEIGFEQAFEPGVDRLIHQESVAFWNLQTGQVPVTPAERVAIIDRVQQYCVVKGFTCRIVR